MLNYFWVSLGGAIGTAARFWLSGIVAQRYGQTFPYGTLAVNVTGSFVIGLFAALTDPEIRRKLEDLGQDIPTPEQMQPAAFDAYQRAEFAKWKPIIEKANVKVE